MRSVPGSSWCGKAVTCACGDVSAVGFREPAGAWQWFRLGVDSEFRFGMDSGFRFGFPRVALMCAACEG